jgi:hypothetical protein
MSTHEKEEVNERVTGLEEIDEAAAELEAILSAPVPLRKTSVTPLPSDKVLKRLLQKVEGSTDKGLCWSLSISSPRNKAWIERLQQLGFTLSEGNDCWIWKENASTGSNGTRPQAAADDGRTVWAYHLTSAAWHGEPFSSEGWDLHHHCGNSLCVRPGLGHGDPMPTQLHSYIHKEVGRSGKEK